MILVILIKRKTHFTSLFFLLILCSLIQVFIYNKLHTTKVTLSHSTLYQIADVEHMNESTTCIISLTEVTNFSYQHAVLTSIHWYKRNRIQIRLIQFNLMKTSLASFNYSSTARNTQPILKTPNSKKTHLIPPRTPSLKS